MVTDPLAREAAKIGKLMNVDMELSTGIWSFSKKRKVTVRNSTSSIHRALPVNVSFYASPQGGTAVNTAEVYLLPEEVSVFTAALRQQARLFPTNYLQQVTAADVICCLRLESVECAVHFAERLAEAFRVLEKQLPFVASMPSYAL